MDLAKLSSTLSYAISLFGALTNPFCEKEEQRNKPKRGWLGETFSREITEKCLFGSPQPSTSLDEKDFLGIVEQFETRIGTLKKITNKRGEGVSSPGRTRACSSPQTGPTRSSPSQTVPPQKSLKKINQQEQTTPSMSKLLEQDLFFGGPPEKQNTNPLHKSSEGHPLEVQKVSSLMRFFFFSFLFFLFFLFSLFLFSLFSLFSFFSFLFFLSFSFEVSELEIGSKQYKKGTSEHGEQKKISNERENLELSEKKKRV